VCRRTDPTLQVVDAWAGGDVSRVIIDGAPPLEGETIAAQCLDFARRFDHLRLKLIQPPHGALHMCPVLLLPPRDPAADLGVIIMESMGYPPISGSNLFCASAVALEHGFVPLREPQTPLCIETPAGLVTIKAHCLAGSCHRVSFENSPARIKARLDASIGPAAGTVPVAVVAAGVDYAVVDAARLGIPLEPVRDAVLLEAGTALAGAAETDFVLFHGRIHAGELGLHCTVCVFQNPAVICRSPTGTGTSAMLVLAHERGLIQPGESLAARSPGGGLFVGRILGVSERPGGAVLRTVVAGDVKTGPLLTIS